MPNAKINALVNVLNGAFSQMKLSDSFLSKLPDNSWHVIVNLDNNKINVESFRMDSILIETGNFVAADEMYWYSKVIPIVTAILAENLSNLSADDIVRFRFNNEEHEKVFWCDAYTLVLHVREIKMGDFGTMMSIMESE